MKAPIIYFLFLVNSISCFSQSTGWHTDYKAALKNAENVLKLRCNDLDSLPASIGKFTNLEELDLSLSRISKLPPEIGDLRKLERLKIWSTNLTSLPKEIGDLLQLRYLDVGENEITELPKEI